MLQKWLEDAKPPKWLWRSIAAIVLGGQVATRILKGASPTAIRLTLSPRQLSWNLMDRSPDGSCLSLPDHMRIKHHAALSSPRSEAVPRSPPDSSAGKIHWRNTYEQLKLVGPRSMGVALLTAGFVGMVFTIQVPITSLPKVQLLQTSSSS